MAPVITDPKVEDILGSDKAALFMLYWNKLPKFLRYFLTNILISLFGSAILYMQGTDVTFYLLVGSLMKAIFDTLVPYLRAANERLNAYREGI